ncbi:MAG: leucine-rich repeat protein [Bacteroidales bacterium]|nr:leucine-rich repeat protein [Bacteroidales bacterium]
MKKLSILLVMLLCISANIFAQDWAEENSDGVVIFYNITSSTEPRTVEVAPLDLNEYWFLDEYKYAGVINIPESVTYDGNTYSVTSIGEEAFAGCTGLTSITIPNSVTSIGDYAFYYCSNLTSITIPNSVTSIGDWAFYHCSGLTSVTIPNSVTSIGDYAFYKCLGLTNKLTLHNVKSIGDYAFEDCKNLHYVYLGEGIETIGEYAFSKLSRLDTIRIKAHYPPTIQANTFNGVNVATPLVVPCGRLTYYQNAETWSNFVNIIEDCNMSDGDVSIEEVAEESMLRIYPNPVMDNAVLSIDNLKEDVKVILTDEQGRQVSLSTMKAGEREINLNTNSLSNGIYFVRIVGETIQRTEKIIKK